MGVGRRGGFTLIELLIVIVIILLLAALLMPAIIQALCAAREGAARHLISQLEQASKSYEIDVGTYPPGNGSGSSQLAFYLQRQGPKKEPYFEFLPGMLKDGPNPDIVNPVFGGESGGESVIYYRNNKISGGVPSPTPIHTKGVDIWAAGCTFPDGGQQSQWAVCNW